MTVWELGRSSSFGTTAFPELSVRNKNSGDSLYIKDNPNPTLPLQMNLEVPPLYSTPDPVEDIGAEMCFPKPTDIPYVPAVSYCSKGPLPLPPYTLPSLERPENTTSKVRIKREPKHYTKGESWSLFGICTLLPQFC